MQLLGHSSVGVTAGYAHGTPTVIQGAVDKLEEPSRLLKNSLSVRKREIWSAATCRSFYSGVTRDRKCQGFSNRAIGKRRQVAALQKGWLSRISFSATC